MSFLHPAALLWGLLAIPIVLLYIRAWRRREQQISTFMLWQRAIARRSRWSRWQTPVSLSLQLSILGLLVISLTHPFWTSSFERARRVVLVIDTSASMSATDVKPNRLAVSIDHARRLVDGLGLFERMAILSAGHSTRVHCGFTGDRRTLNRAIDSISSSDAPSDIADAVTLGRRMLDGERSGHIVVLSDGSRNQAAELPEAGNVHLVRAGGSGDNVGITRLEVRPSRVTPNEQHVFIEVTNFAKSAIQCQLDVNIPGTTGVKLPVRFAPGESVRHSFTMDSAAGGLLVAELDRADDLTADNRAQVLVVPRRIQQVLLVTGDHAAPDGKQKSHAVRLEQALRSMPLLQLTVTSLSPETLPLETIMVCQGVVPPKLPAGPVLAIAPGASCELWELEEPVTGSVVARSQLSSPLLKSIDLSNVVIEELVRLRFSAPAETLASSTSGDPLYSLIDRPEGPLLVLHVPLDESDLTLRPEFPLLLNNAIRFLGNVDEVFYPAMTTADSAIIAATSTTRQLRSPTGQQQELPAGERAVVPLDHTGLWTVTEQSGQVANAAANQPLLVMASNLADSGESDLQSASEIGSAQLDTLQGTSGLPLWIYLLGLAIVLMVGDWMLFHRRVLV